MKRPEGSIQPTPHYDMTFRVPIHQLLADKAIKREGPGRFLVISTENINIEIFGRLEKVLTPGCRFFSITHDWEQDLHTCQLDHSVRKGA